MASTEAITSDFFMMEAFQAKDVGVKSRQKISVGHVTTTLSLGIRLTQWVLLMH